MKLKSVKMNEGNFFFKMNKKKRRKLENELSQIYESFIKEVKA